MYLSDLLFLLHVFENHEKSRCSHNDVSYSYSAISLLYLHIINIPMHVICRATTDHNGQQRTTTDDVVRYRIEVDVRRRAVCELD